MRRGDIIRERDLSAPEHTARPGCYSNWLRYSKSTRSAVPYESMVHGNLQTIKGINTHLYLYLSMPCTSTPPRPSRWQRPKPSPTRSHRSASRSPQGASPQTRNPVEAARACTSDRGNTRACRRALPSPLDCPPSASPTPHVRGRRPSRDLRGRIP
jgi:hypothetical protein